jgi:hypothetical protein
MTKIVRVDMGGGKTVLIESDDENYDLSSLETAGDERKPISRGATFDRAVEQFKGVQETIRDYTSYTLEAFKGLAFANVSKIKLEFGLKLVGKAGIPLVTSGSAEGSLKITVECTFPENGKK